jgi:hypothetical protein
MDKITLSPQEYFFLFNDISVRIVVEKATRQCQEVGNASYAVAGICLRKVRLQKEEFP